MMARKKIGISDIISDVMSTIMKKEREFFLPARESV